VVPAEADLVAFGVLDGAPEWAKRLVSSLRRLPARVALAALYGWRLCASESCDRLIGMAAGAAVEARLLGLKVGEVLEALPRHARFHVEKALAEAEEAHIRSPSTVYGQVALDADALARMGALNAALAGAAGMQGLLNTLAEAMSWAAASDYVLYTSAARAYASRVMRPHTLAYAKWVAEELAYLGYTAMPRTETGSGGIVSYLDLRRCPCGAAEKEITVKPLAACIEYRIAYRCCRDRLEVRLCTPESTRIR
jgi:hypothetical protein